MSLPESIIAGATGHVGHHNDIHELLNDGFAVADAPDVDLTDIAEGDGVRWDASAGKLKRNASRKFNACDFGASTGATGAANTIAIEAAIAAAIADAGPRSVVYFGRPGVYLYEDIFVDGDGYILDGDGHTTLRSTVGVNAANLMLWLQGNHIKVLGIDFDYTTPVVVGTDGPGRSSSARTIRIGGFRAVSPVDNWWGEDVEVSYCNFLDSRNTPIEFWFANGARAYGNTMLRSLGNGIFTGQCQYDLRIEGNTITDTGDDGTFIACDSNVPAGTVNVVVARNFYRENSSKSVGACGVKGLVVAHNFMDTTFSPAIQLNADLASTNADVTITENTIRNAGAHYGAGLFQTTVATNANGIEITGGNNTRVKITGNRILDTEKRGINIVDCAELQIERNEIVTAAGTGMEVGQTADTSYTKVTDVKITDNTVRGTVSGIVLGSASRATIQGNTVRTWDSGSAGETRAIFVSYVRETMVANNLMVNDDTGTYGYRVNPSSTNYAVRDWNNQLVVPASDEANRSGATHADLATVTANQHHNQAHTDTDHDAATVKAVAGGKETVVAHGATGSTETINIATGNVHTATLDAGCTFTFSGATASTGCAFTLILTQNGTGGFAVVWPASVDWAAGAAPVLSTGANKVSVLSFLSTDGGTTWLGFLGGDDLR